MTVLEQRTVTLQLKMIRKLNSSTVCVIRTLCSMRGSALGREGARLTADHLRRKDRVFVFAGLDYWTVIILCKRVILPSLTLVRHLVSPREIFTTDHFSLSVNGNASDSPQGLWTVSSLPMEGSGSFLRQKITPSVDEMPSDNRLAATVYK